MKSGMPQPMAVKAAAKPLAVINGNIQAMAAAPRLIPGLTGAFQDPAALRAQVAKLRAEAKSPAVANSNNKAAANNNNHSNRAAAPGTTGSKAGSSVDDEERAPRQATLWDAIGNTGFGAARGEASDWVEAANLNVFTMEAGRPGGNFSALLLRRKQGGAGTTWAKKASVHDGSDSDATGTASCDDGELGLDLSHANSSLLLSPAGGGASGGLVSPRSATDTTAAGFPALPTKDPPPPAFHVSDPNATVTTGAGGATGNGTGGPPPVLSDYVDDDVDILALVAAQEEKERQQQEALRREIGLQQLQLAGGGGDDHVAYITAAGLTDTVITTVVNIADATNNATTDCADTVEQALSQQTQALAVAAAAAADPVVAYDIVYSSEGCEVVLEPTSNGYYRLEDVFGVPRAALAFADCPGEDGNVYRCVAVTASMAATRAALAQAWLEAQEADRAAAAAAAAAQEQQLLLQQQRAAAQQAAVMTASELVFGVQQPQQLPAWQAAAGVGAKVAAAGGSPYGGAATGAGAVAAGGEDDDDDVSDLMALLCA
ncbi:hypothetical protein HXX76_013856 [Chlamydomonas incerta]|uniref:Uncharacterized protein n=1 Tax=Chlamydomonas incerta TaxID=51695 RepID=A0A835SE33_CHLIN|nr:hypothetical protein HXX76_013856 [Chlamydomonas incerta]|eukprot:KAG2425274.1 hypothetical protein HXX76_013856 [Chlamydomonas incerta]